MRYLHYVDGAWQSGELSIRCHCNSYGDFADVVSLGVGHAEIVTVEGCYMIQHILVYKS